MFKKPPFLARFALAIVCIILCFMLIGSVITAVVLTDLRTVYSSSYLKQVLNQIAAAQSEKNEPSAQQVNPNLVFLSATNPIAGTNPGEVIDPSQLPGNIDFSDMNSLLNLLTQEGMASFVQDLAQDFLGEDSPVTAEDIQTIMTESTIIDYVTDKVDSFLDDCINGTSNTVITVEELMDLLEENQEVLEKTLHTTITPEKKKDVQVNLEQFLKESDINNTIQETITTVRETEIDIPEYGTMTVAEILDKVAQITTQKAIASAISSCVVLGLLLLALSYYNPGHGLRRIGFSLTVAGIPFAGLQYLIGSLDASAAAQLSLPPQLLSSIQSAFVPLKTVHYGVFVSGIVLIVVGIVVSIVLPAKE